MDDEAFALELARAVRAGVVPHAGSVAARRRAGTAAGGDPTYAIDAEAERIVRLAFDERTDVAYFTEDEGLVVRGSPRTLFLIDPIDGTRPAAAGFETCCVSIALAPFGDGLTLGDVTYGCLVEVTTGAVFEARRGGGASGDRPMRPSAHQGLRGAFWAGGFRGQPVVETATVLRDLFDAPGSEGAFFDQGSAAYSLASLATGRLDAFVDVGRTILDSIPQLEDAWHRLGDGHALNTTTYDLAAGYVLAREAGCTITDGTGADLDATPLFTADGKAETVGTVAAGTLQLHRAALDAEQRGIEALRQAVAAD